MDLIRNLLLRLEDMVISPGVERSISPYNPAWSFEGFTVEDVAHHMRMLVSADFVDTGGPAFGADGSLYFKQINWKGRDFLDSVRDPKVLAKTKEGAIGAGGFTVDLLKDLAKGFVKKQIEEHTGITL